MKAKTIAATAFGLWLASGAAAQPISVSYPVPTLDRWMYPFGGQPVNVRRADIGCVVRRNITVTVIIRENQQEIRRCCP